MIVLDASAVVELLLNLPLAGQIRRRLTDPVLGVHAPQLCVVEVLQVIRRREREHRATPQAAATAVGLLPELDISYHEHQILARRIWELRHNLTAYDAAYVALAEALGAPLVTTDARMARAPGHQARIELMAPAS